MAVHIDFVKHSKKGMAIDYTFLDRHTGEELAFGTYNSGRFEVLNFQDGCIDIYVSASVAWTSLNRRLTDAYGY